MGSQELIVKKKEFDKHLELNVIENIEKQFKELNKYDSHRSVISGITSMAPNALNAGRRDTDGMVPFGNRYREKLNTSQPSGSKKPKNLD